MRKEYGGCSGNIAYSMQLLGGKPVPVATVGEDAGEYLERLQGLGIDVSRIKTIPETFTAQCFIDRPGRQSDHRVPCRAERRDRRQGGLGHRGARRRKACSPTRNG